MSIFIFQGIIGCGKTAAVTWCLHQDGLQTRKIYANYVLKFPYTYLKGLGEFSNWPKEPCSIGIDEAHSAGLDSRSALSPINKFYTRNMTQARKIQSHVYMSAQDISFIDLRVRRITAYLFEPEVVEWDENGMPTFLEVKYTSRPWRPVWEGEIEIPLDMGHGNVCEMYDTSEIIEEMEDPGQVQVLDLVLKYKDHIDKSIKAITAWIKANERGINTTMAADAANLIKAGF